MSITQASQNRPIEPSQLVPLSCLRDGDRGWLHMTNLCCDDCELLNAMGLTELCEIRVCRMGEPCIVQVNSTRLGLAAALARNILVRTGPVSTD